MYTDAYVLGSDHIIACSLVARHLIDLFLLLLLPLFLLLGPKNHDNTPIHLTFSFLGILNLNLQFVFLVESRQLCIYMYTRLRAYNVTKRLKI